MRIHLDASVVVISTEREREREMNPSTATYYDDRVNECEWYHHTTIVLYHMLSNLPCTCELYIPCAM